MLNIGCHVSSGKGYVNMYKDTIYVGGNTFQFFTRNPRGGSVKEVDIDDLNKFIELSQKDNFAYLLAHAPYTLNCASKDPHIREFAIKVFKEDLKVLNLLPKVYYNFHPGSHVGQGEEEGISLIIDALNNVIEEDQPTMILLETMAGKGSEIGYTFEQIRKIMDGVTFKDKVGVCLDTCHVSDGGYDIVNDLDGVLNHFDQVIGLDHLKAIHLNDSKNIMGARKDRHEKIGEGYLGRETFRKIINHPKLKDLPFILETPNELDGYKEEIELLKGMKED
ncbi:MAG: deoxyribonuclease IV [Bacilli bacterium]|nr:deoxyribonuclease IV [Bacillales bacterium]MDY2574776.1 deoxyribonuclease IV [Bacilli bacterium]